MSDPFVIPSLEQVEEMERQQLQAFQSLEYVVSEDGGQRQAVKCQGCHAAVPIPMLGVGVFKASLVGKIKSKQIQLRWIEKFPHSNSTNKQAELNAVRQELTALQEEAKAQSGRLPLNSSRITRHKYVCSKCYDWALRYSHPRPYPRARFPDAD
jgi:hypothetical protein